MRIAEWLSINGFDVTVFGLHEEGSAYLEIIDGYLINRVSLFTRKFSKHRTVQLFKYVEWLLRVIWLSKRMNVVHCNDLNTLPVGVLLKVLTLGRMKVVYDAHEFESNQVPNQSRWSIKALQFLESVLIRFADAVITVSDGIAREYARLYAIKKPALVMNCPPYQEIEKNNKFRERFDIHIDATIFLYQGAVTKGRGIERMLDAFAVLDDPKQVLVVMGYGPLVGLVETHAAKSKNIHYHPAVAPKGLLEYTASADCGLCLIEDSCFSYRYCSPNKLFEYIMAGLPVLVSNIEGLKTWVNVTGAGGVVDDESTEGLVRSIRNFKNADKQLLRVNVRQASKKYCWEEQLCVLKAVYGGLSCLQSDVTLA
ncbi:MAG: glycosyltransferase [Proteobacteria bacterium]|nr:glycosyltransferase [Pseudomonadota bacterium]